MKPAFGAFLAVASLHFALTSVPTHAQTIDPSASVVHLRKTCGIDDCFTQTSDLTTWLWGGGGSDRSSPPSASDRVVVHVGPGEFDPFVCDGSTEERGYVSVVGSGRQTSRFLRTSGDIILGACHGAIHVENCQEMDFSHLAGIGETGILWKGGGEATWSDVDMIGTTTSPTTCGSLGALGWYDVSGAGGKSLHYFFGSRAFARNHPIVNAFDAGDAEVWWYGGDIVTEATNSPTVTAVGLNVFGSGDVRVFGATIRSQMLSGASGSGVLGVWVHGGGTFHMHGGIINASADASGANVNATGILAQGSNASAHTPGTAFVVKPGGTGSATRLSASGGAMVDSPFFWPPSDTPPQAATLHGSDAFVDTDAGAGGGESHLMVHDAGCSAGGGPWRDMVNGACRQ